ncbi:MAG: hypothetical protein RBT69_05240 [Spirochaetia bacterium]|jgi:hypothetical protein|nr:hypothetical protein [Spirochaetia bacterium]
MKINRFIIILIIISFTIISILILYKYQSPEQRKIVLWTDNPELISYVESFNSEHSSVKVEIVYQENPARELMKSKKHPDIIIGTYLNSSQVIDNFRKINHLFKKNRIEKDSFYKQLLQKGSKNGKQLLMPVSFNLPALMFRRGDVSYNISNFVLTNDNIIEISKTFNQEGNKGVSAFSPRWNSTMLYYNAVMSKADFRGNDNKKISWNIEGIEKSLKETRDFINTINGGIAKDIRFEEKYLYKPVENLIAEQRIFFAYTDLKEFYAIAQQKRAGLNFRWLASEDKIPVCDDIIYAGIPRHAANKRGAELFFLWFFDHDTQERIMESGKTKRIRSFGLCSGFSSLKTVNEQVFPKYYPLLVGHIPPQNILSFPSPLPVEWEQLKNEIIKKWLYREAANEKTQSDLESAIKDWYKIHPEF